MFAESWNLNLFEKRGISVVREKCIGEVLEINVVDKNHILIGKWFAAKERFFNCEKSHFFVF